MNSREIVAITPTAVKAEIAKMTGAEIEKVVEQSMIFKEATDMDVLYAMNAISELNNNEIGTSNKVVCGMINLNHWAVIQFMKDKGWIDDNNLLTPHGFRDMNDAIGVATVNIDTDTLVLQNYNGSLYWNRYHDEYERIIEIVIAGVNSGGYNDNLKGIMPPISRQTRKMLLGIPTITVENKHGRITK